MNRKRRRPLKNYTYEELLDHEIGILKKYNAVEEDLAKSIKTYCMAGDGEVNKMGWMIVVHKKKELPLEGDKDKSKPGFIIYAEDADYLIDRKRREDERRLKGLPIGKLE